MNDTYATDTQPQTTGPSRRKGSDNVADKVSRDCDESDQPTGGRKNRRKVQLAVRNAKHDNDKLCSGRLRMEQQSERRRNGGEQIRHCGVELRERGESGRMASDKRADGELNICAVPREWLDETWPVILGDLERCLAHEPEGWTQESVLEALKTKEIYLFLGHIEKEYKGFLIGYPSKLPKGWDFKIWFLAGEYGIFDKKYLPAFEAYFKRFGIYSIS